MNKKIYLSIHSINLILFLTLLFSVETQVRAQDPGWPRQKVTKAGKLVYYQPQVDSWTDHKRLTFRTAMTVTPAGQPAAIGVAVIQAQTDVNIDDRMVRLHDLVISETHFPSLDSAAAAKIDQTVKTFLPADATISISLDRLVASVAKPDNIPGVEVKNDPPMIFVSERAAILLQMDGDPVWGKIKETDLEFVVNSNFPIFVHRPKSTYYLFTGQQWLSTQDLQGQWSRAAKLPDDMNKVKKDPQWAGLASVIPAKPTTTPVPAVFYATTPAEVILSKGTPVYTAIPGTGLVYAANTDSDLFVHSPTRSFYYLAAGRWFRAMSLQGPWTYASADLPTDFSKIPDNSPAARVLAYVPGTDAAKDAVLIAQIPTTTEVDAKRAAANAKVTYTGTPEFKPIEGTSLFYATNTTERVIRVDNVHYLCLNGVWFYSPSPQGPWTTAASVPAAIYSIPPSSPVYNVTYVTQTASTAGVIRSSYTAGYLGTFIVRTGFGVVIFNGSGYYYPPYFYYPVYGYPIYWPYAATYGVWAYAGRYAVARGVYGPYRGIAGGAAYNPYTGTYARRVTAYGPYGSASVGRAYNPYTGTVARGASVRTPYGNVAGVATSSGAKAVVGRGNYNSGGVVKTAGGDVYAGKNGNVYKKTGSGWSSVNAPTPKAQIPSSTISNLNTEALNRQRGAAQTRSYQPAQMPRAGAYGARRSWGVGGRRRR